MELILSSLFLAEIFKKLSSTIIICGGGIIKRNPEDMLSKIVILNYSYMKQFRVIFQNDFFHNSYLIN